jgi:hypothetical protein
MPRSRLSIAVAFLGLLSCAAHPAVADVYAREGHRFDISGLTLAQVQDAVVKSLSFYVEDLHPAWDGALCYDFAAGSAADVADVTKTFDLLNARLAEHIDRCVPGGSGLIYYFKQGAVDAATRKRLLALATGSVGANNSVADVLDGKSSCGAQLAFKKESWRKVAIHAAVVAIDGQGLSRDDRENCLFLTTVAMLGLGIPAQLPDFYAGKDDRKMQVEFNLLALFVLQVIAEDQRGWQRAEVEGKARSVLLIMHELGKT